MAAKHEHDAGILIYKMKSGIPYFLFLKRREDWLDIPKGHAEREEKEIQTAIRETFEETGLRIAEKEIDPFFKFYLRYRPSSKILKDVAVFLSMNKKKPKVSSEHVGYKWLDAEKAMSSLKFKNQAQLIKAADSYIRKKMALDSINEEYAKLAKTKGWKLSGRFVKGEGNPNSRVFVVGQAPGNNENNEMRPFIGVSGRLLDELLDMASIGRNNAYITSVVQFFPFNNRIPSREEISLCKPYLIKQIKAIKPKLVVLLGNVAAETVLGMGKVMDHHGSVIKKGNKFYFITMHPAAAIRIRKNIPAIKNDFRKLGKFVKKNKILLQDF